MKGDAPPRGEKFEQSYCSRRGGRKTLEGHKGKSLEQKIPVN